MSKVKDGFFHQIDSKIGDSSYLLDANGGTIKVGSGGGANNISVGLVSVCAVDWVAVRD